MSEAEKIVDKGEVPSKLQEAADEVMEVCKQGFVNLEREPEDGILHQRNRDFGLHAYRYEVMGDDSVVALYANTKSGNVKMKAFSSIEEASNWSPRDER